MKNQHDNYGLATIAAHEKRQYQATDQIAAEAAKSADETNWENYTWRKNRIKAAIEEATNAITSGRDYWKASFEHEREKVIRLSNQMNDKEPNQIAAGDIVSVNFNGAQITLCHEAEVLYVPCATGDSWHFKDAKTGEIHYVSEGCTITKKTTPATAMKEEG